MFKHGYRTRRGENLTKVLLVLVILLIVIVLLVGAAAYSWYGRASQPVSSSTEVKSVTIRTNTSVKEMGDLLESEGLIKDALAFQLYVRRNNLVNQLKAGVYELSPSWTLEEVVNAIVSGREASSLFTVGPGLRLDQIKERLVKAGFSQSESEDALSTTPYSGHPVFQYKPANASLEGYVFPETFTITASSRPEDIIRQSLDQMSEKLTPELLKKFEQQGLSAHEAIILASIIEKEVSGAEDRRLVAQVMLKRLREGIMLGADATYLYAAAVYGGDPFPNNESPYNTRKYTGLPPGPISNVGLSALEAVANPADTDYLFYVTGDDGTNHFTKTAAEHEAAVKKYCTEACAPGYIAPEFVD